MSVVYVSHEREKWWKWRELEDVNYQKGGIGSTGNGSFDYIHLAVNGGRHQNSYSAFRMLVVHRHGSIPNDP